MITITPAAVEQLKGFLTEQGTPDGALRVFVAPGGCSGLQYGMTLEEAFHQPRLDVSGEGRAVLDSRLPDDVARAVAALMPVVREPLSVYPVHYACPSAVLRDAVAGLNFGMGEIASPWAGAVAESG